MKRLRRHMTVLACPSIQAYLEDKQANELPVSCGIAWYEQKAVAVLLALLFLGVK
jgi:hydroxylamine reductase